MDFAAEVKTLFVCWSKSDKDEGADPSQAACRSRRIGCLFLSLKRRLFLNTIKRPCKTFRSSTRIHQNLLYSSWLGLFPSLLTFKCGNYDMSPWQYKVMIYSNEWYLLSVQPSKSSPAPGKSSFTKRVQNTSEAECSWLLADKTSKWCSSAWKGVNCLFQTCLHVTPKTTLTLDNMLREQLWAEQSQHPGKIFIGPV